MKVFSFLLIISVFILSGCNNATEDKSEQTTEKTEVNYENVVLIDMDVNGMTCTGCENTIKSGVSELEGIVSVEASHVDGKTYVKADTALVKPEQIREVIKEKGYEVVNADIKNADDSTLPKKEGSE
jgi:copper chaperone CopZ